MTIWKIGIDLEHSSYEELEARKFVAQGWPELPSLSCLIGQSSITEEVTNLTKGIEDYKDSADYIANVFNILLNIRPGDIVLGYEGRTLKGICEISKYARYVYDFDGKMTGIPPTKYNKKDYNYTHGWYPVKWVEWENDFTNYLQGGHSPGGGQYGPPGICGCSDTEGKDIPHSWERYKSSNPTYFKELEEMVMSQEYYNRMIQTGIHQMIFYGPPGTGKTHDAKAIAESFPNVEDRITTIQFHPAYTYEDFIRGIRVSTESGKDTPRYKTENGVITKLAVNAFKAWKVAGCPSPTADGFVGCSKWVLVIDEINRAHLAAVLGELIYALEYRPQKFDEIEKHKIRTPYSIADDEQNDNGFELLKLDEIVIPPNLFIIGTMNTADRSIGHLDYAVRRRFLFEQKLPLKQKIEEQTSNLRQAVTLFDELQKFFIGNRATGFHIDDLMPGHTYFLADTLEILANKLAYQVYPLIREYVKDGVLVNKAEKDLWGTSPFNDDVIFNDVYKYVLGMP